MKPILLTAVAFTISASLEFAQTAPPQASGYQLAFSENFANFDLSSNGSGTHTWYPGLYFQSQLPQPGAISVSNSTLDLEWYQGNNENATSIEGCSYDASHCNAFRYGYFEAQMKWDVTNGAWPAFWMITKQGILGAQHVGELDIFEGQGDDPTHFYGTINEWNGADLISTNSLGNNRFPLPADNDFAQWHTYGLLWVPGTVTWYYDNQPVGSAPTPAIFDQQDFFIVLGSEEGNYWTPGNLTNVTASSIDLNVQWVHVFQPAPPPVSTSTNRQTPISNPVPAIVTSGQAVNLGPLPGSQNLSLKLNLPVQNQSALTNLLQQISDPQSPQYHQYLAPNDFAASFGPSQQDYNAVVDWAQSNGLTVTGTKQDRLSLSVSGTVQTINQAFQISLNSYRDPTTGSIFFSPNQEPSLDLSVQLLAITGLTSTSPELIRATSVPNGRIENNDGTKTKPAFPAPTGYRATRFAPVSRKD